MMETATLALPDLELRSEGDERILSVRCVPYGEVSHKAGKRPERFAPGAFATAAAGAARIRLTDENHATGRRPVGVAKTLTDRPDGLYGDYRFYRTPEGRAALENVTEGTYGGVSVGFVAVDEAIVDGIREIRSARLFHVSLVDEPAYDGAEILSLRAAQESRYAALLRKPDLSQLDDEPAESVSAWLRKILA